MDYQRTPIWIFTRWATEWEADSYQAGYNGAISSSRGAGYSGYRRHEISAKGAKTCIKVSAPIRSWSSMLCFVSWTMVGQGPQMGSCYRHQGSWFKEYLCQGLPKRTRLAQTYSTAETKVCGWRGLKPKAGFRVDDASGESKVGQNTQRMGWMSRTTRVLIRSRKWNTPATYRWTW